MVCFTFPDIMGGAPGSDFVKPLVRGSNPFAGSKTHETIIMCGTEKGSISNPMAGPLYIVSWEA